MSSESEWSCRVEGSGSQCNVLIQPNHQSVLVRERQDRQKEREDGATRRRRAIGGHKQALKIRKTEAGRQREECVLIEERQRAGGKGKEKIFQNSSSIFTWLIYTQEHAGRTQHDIKTPNANNPHLSLSLCLTHKHTDLGPAFPSPESWLPASLPTDLLEGDMGAGTR